MSKKKKRRRRSRPGPGPVPARVEEAALEETEEAPADGPGETAAAPRGPFGRGAPSPFPPFGESMAAGFRAVGGQPVILATAFLSLLATWGLFAAIGEPLHPALLGAVLSVPPVPVIFIDVPIALGVATSPVGGLVLLGGVLLLRSVTLGLLIVFIAQAERDGRIELRAAFAAMPAITLRLVGLLFLEAAGLVFATEVLGPLLGNVNILLVGLGLYFLVYVPIVAVVEDVRSRDALRRGVRAARLPGTRHVGMVLGYFFLTFYGLVVSPFGSVAPATPTFLAWAYALLTTFLHAGVLAAFVYRWLRVRDQVPSGPAPRGRRDA